jgi:hypothetical protein
MSNVIDIGCKTKLDIPVEKILEASKDLDVAIVIGWRDDNFSLAMSSGDIAEASILLDLAKAVLMDTLLSG